MNQQTTRPISLGATYRDMVTGFTGIAVAKTEYLFACNRVSLQPQALHEGKAIEWQAFDAHQLEYIDAGIMKKVAEATAAPDMKPGGPGAVAPLPRGPERR